MSVLVGTTAMATVGGGCAFPGSRQSTPENRPNVGATVDASQEQPSGYSDSVALFGDVPAREAVPSEGALHARVRQHSFTTDGQDFDPDVYAPANLLVFASTRNAEHPEICVKQVSGSTVTQLTWDNSDDIQPRFSPDGSRIAFCSNRAGSWDLWLIHADGTGLAQLTTDSSDELAPCWSPDGTQLAYTTWGARTHQWEIWILEFANPKQRQFVTCGMFPAWSPDGSRLAFQRARPRGSRLFSIWTVDLRSGLACAPTEIAQSEFMACIAPRWSPTGEMLVYCAVPEAARVASGDAHPQAQLWLVNLASSLRSRLSTLDAAPAFNPTWAGDGRVFYVSARAGAENIYSLDPDPCCEGDQSALRLSRALPENPQPLE